MNTRDDVLQEQRWLGISEYLLDRLGRTVLRTAIAVHNERLGFREGLVEPSHDCFDDGLDRGSVVEGRNRDKEVRPPDIFQSPPRSLGQNIDVHKKKSKIGKRKG